MKRQGCNGCEKFKRLKELGTQPNLNNTLKWDTKVYVKNKRSTLIDINSVHSKSKYASR